MRDTVDCDLILVMDRYDRQEVEREVSEGGKRWWEVVVGVDALRVQCQRLPLGGFAALVLEALSASPSCLMPLRHTPTRAARLRSYVCVCVVRTHALPPSLTKH